MIKNVKMKKYSKKVEDVKKTEKCDLKFGINKYYNDLQHFNFIK